VTRFREIENAKRLAQSEANRKGCEMVVISVGTMLWVRRNTESKVAGITERHPNAKVVAVLTPENAPMFGDGAA
jgi:hypothetical protein